MCVGAPEPPPPPAARQEMKAPKDNTEGLANSMAQRRGFWATIMTSPQGIVAAPGVTGTPGV